MRKLINSTLMLALMFLGANTSMAQMGPTMGNQTAAMLEASPAGMRLIEFVKMVNSDKEVTDDEFKQVVSEGLIKKHGLARLKQMIVSDLKENDGKITLYQVKRVSQFTYEVFAKGTMEPEGWLKMKFLLEEEEPYKLNGLELDAVDEGPTGDAKPMKIGQ